MPSFVFLCEILKIYPQFYFYTSTKTYSCLQTLDKDESFYCACSALASKHSKIVYSTVKGFI